MSVAMDNQIRRLPLRHCPVHGSRRTPNCSPKVDEAAREPDAVWRRRTGFAAAAHHEGRRTWGETAWRRGRGAHHGQFPDESIAGGDFRGRASPQESATLVYRRIRSEPIRRRQSCSLCHGSVFLQPSHQRRVNRNETNTMTEPQQLPSASRVPLLYYLAGAQSR